MKKEPVNIITILWGDVYGEEDVNILYSMIRRNTAFPINFHLFSNEPLPGLNPDIIRHPEPTLDIAAEHNRYAYRKEAGLCDDTLGGLTGRRVFFFDLDVLIMDNLDELFSHPEGDGFYIINDWHTRGDHVGQATCYSFVVGTLGFVRQAFENDPELIIRKFGTASQEYLSSKVIERFGSMNFWPEAWFQSFRFHCMPWGPLKRFITPHKPKPGTKVLAFHGHPDIQDAIAGHWPDKKKHRWKIWKKLYKHCRPTPWIEEYWH